MADPTPEVKRILSLLESVIAFKKVPIGTIENALEVSQGYLARILRGDVVLKYQQLLDVLEILAVPPEEFFAIAYRWQGHPDAAVSDFFTRHNAPKTAEEIEKQAEERPLAEMVEEMIRILIEKKALRPLTEPEDPEDPPENEGGSQGESDNQG